MIIYAIGDLHLSFNDNKPMDIFGENWKNHYEKIEKNWLKKIKPEDVVLLPGDFSWATNLNGTQKDFEFLNKLPGKKVLINGNHDYWWNTLQKMETFLTKCKIKEVYILKNNAVEIDNVIFVGTRGWAFNDTENGEKMYKRETIRLENSIKYAYQNFENVAEKEIICMMHYPPITKNMIEKNENSKYLELMKKYNIHKCIYGHLHGEAHKEAIEGNVYGVELKLVSSDFINFDPVRVL